MNFTILDQLAKFNSLYSGVRNTLDQCETSGEVQYMESMELNVVHHPNNFTIFITLCPFMYLVIVEPVNIEASKFVEIVYAETTQSLGP